MTDEYNDSDDITDEVNSTDGVTDKQCMTDDITDEVNMKIEYFDEHIIKTSENDLILHSNFNINKIISYNDDVTDSVNFENYLILSTSSGYLKCTNINEYSEGEYIFNGKIIQGHSDSITSMRIYKDYILTGSKDRTAILWKLLNQDGSINFCKIQIFDEFVESITAVALYGDLIAISSYDNILQIFRNSTELESGENTSEIYFDNIFTQIIHSKQINHLSITPSYIISSSSDKSAKIFSHSGQLIKTLNSDKILHSSFNSKYIALCGYKSIKIYDSNLSQVAALQSKNPVLSSCFYKDYLIAATDVLRIYDLDKKKCVKSYDLGLTNCWSFCFPFLCAENKIVFLEDESIKVNNDLLDTLRVYKEESLLIDKYCRENNYQEAIKILIRKNDYKKMFRTVCKAYEHYKNLNF